MLQRIQRSIDTISYHYYFSYSGKIHSFTHSLNLITLCRGIQTKYDSSLRRIFQAKNVGFVRGNATRVLNSKTIQEMPQHQRSTSCVSFYDDVRKLNQKIAENSECRRTMRSILHSTSPRENSIMRLGTRKWESFSSSLPQQFQCTFSLPFHEKWAKSTNSHE